ncbi:cell wall protein DAN4 [Acanthopagrus latus]|uniref:cell wall protein DAN4 n=1 Tax=Acanthopagrus latus TaxID=8177 RepID=UPI00187CD942|nr:cell wall protein DAN4 [Acanthopagrus latus]
MIIIFVSLIFICLLPKTASTVTSGQNQSFTNVMTGGLTRQGTSSSNQLSEVAGRGITQSIIVNPTAEKTTKPMTESLHTSPSKTASTTPSQTSTPNIQTAPTLISSSLSQFNSSTEDMKPTTEVSILTTVVFRSSTKHSILRSSTPSQDTGKTVASQFTIDKLPYPSTGLTQPTDLILTTTTSTKTDEHKSTSTSPATGLYTTKKPFIHSTKAKKRQDSPYVNRTNHSKAVAGLIGGALVLMTVGFLLIYVKKRKLQRQQIKTTDWAGPSPFLESGADNGQVTLRSSNRISFSSFLPLRLSKRLSLLPETDEELKDIRLGTTFGDEHGKGMSGQEEDGNDGQDSNRSAVVVIESTGEAPETDINSVSLSSSQTTDSLCKNNNVEVINLSGAHPANPSTSSGAVENAQLNDSLGQP